MNTESLMTFKSCIVEATSTLSMIVTCVALLLIELWGVKKIWKMFRR